MATSISSAMHGIYLRCYLWFDYILAEQFVLLPASSSDFHFINFVLVNMGYSEVYCHICGVSFNMGRVRTKNEPRSHGWREVRSYGKKHSPYVTADRNSWAGECSRNAGCMMVYREDQMREFVKQQRMRDEIPNNHREEGDGNSGEGDPEGYQEGGEPDDPDDGDFVPDEVIMKKLADDAEFRTKSAAYDKIKELVENAASMMSARTHFVSLRDETESQANDSMDYEYESPSETCSEYCSDAKEDSMDFSNPDEEDAIYRDFRKSLTEDDESNSPFTDEEEERGKQEIMLPLFRPLEDRDSASEHGSDASFKCDEEEDSDDYRAEKLDHWLSGKLSHYDHEISKHLKHWQRDNVWEHIAGPGCVNTHGYNGNRITEKEMRFTNISQCLVPKTDAGREGYGDDAPRTATWEADKDDEPWEETSAWFLSGLSDDMPSRDMSNPHVFPERHGRRSINAENVRWSPDEEDMRYAMPFHPACLEIYKRSATARHGIFNVDLLGSWWKLTAQYDEFHSFPRSEAVNRAVSQWWEHYTGDEYLAADPLFPPGLREAISSARISNDLELRVEKASSWNSLPAEVIVNILQYLPAADVARTSLAISATRPFAKQIIQKSLQEEYPSLWELVSTQPYSKWTGQTSWELQCVQKKAGKVEEELERVLETLREEQCVEAYDYVKEQWDQGRETRRKDAFGHVLQEKVPLQIPDDDTGIAKFAISLEEAFKQNRLKGLINRERIWKDCQTILDRIEELQEKGDILPDGQTRPGARLSEDEV